MKEQVSIETTEVVYRDGSVRYLRLLPEMIIEFTIPGRNTTFKFDTPYKFDLGMDQVFYLYSEETVEDNLVITKWWKFWKKEISTRLVFKTKGELV